MSVSSAVTSSRRAVVLAGALLGCSMFSGKPPAPRAPELPVALADTTSAFNSIIERRFTDAAGRRMLQTAEAAYPATGEVLAAALEAPFERTRTLTADSLWWVSAFDGIRIPYAITGDAVRYYLTLNESFRRGQAGPSGITMESSTFSYRARVERRPTFEQNGESFRDVYVVAMDLSWSSRCGNLCALWFEQHRTVVLSFAGAVLRIFGDGVPAVVVS